MRYPEGSEYEYLCWMIGLDGIAEDVAILDAMYPQCQAAYCSGDRPLADRLWREMSEARSAAVERMRHRQDIVYWLSLDTALRREGKTYPDVYEASGWQERDVDFDF